MKTTRLFFLIFPVICIVACGPVPRVALTDSKWNQPTEYAVEGSTQTLLQKKPLKFGEFFTTSVHRSGKSGYVTYTGSGFGGTAQQPYENIIGLEQSHGKQTLHFVLNSNSGLHSNVFAVSKFDSRSLVIGGNPQSNLNWMLRIVGGQSKNTYYVQVFEPGTAKPWELLMDAEAAQMDSRKYLGYFALNNDEYYTIRPLTKLLGKNGKVINFAIGNFGFEIRNKADEPVAAVSTIGKGMVYLSSMSETERFRVANLCSALLLYEPATT